MAAATNSRKTLVALFERSASVKPLMEKLRQTGVSPDRIEVISGLPLHDVETAGLPRIPLYALTMMGGVAGIGVGFFLAAGTA
ncbi:MAG: hypothetical protein K0S45_2772, partial [Nitrospira sp.]|nr:hypothetical protein [Nitrospira sp.]